MRPVVVLTRLAIGGILLGIVGMIQPVAFDLFRWSFLLLLGSTILYTIVSHLPDQPGPATPPPGLGPEPGPEAQEP